MDWKAIAEPWLRVEAETDAAHAPVLDELIAAADLAPGQSVLDIGPGRWRVIAERSQRGWTIGPRDRYRDSAALCRARDCPDT